MPNKKLDFLFIIAWKVAFKTWVYWQTMLMLSLKIQKEFVQLNSHTHLKLKDDLEQDLSAKCIVLKYKCVVL